MGEAINNGILMLLSFQGAYAVSVWLLWGTMFFWYEWGYFEEAGSSKLLKMANGFLLITMGFGYWAGKRLQHHGPLRKRIYLLGYIILYIIVASIFYMIISRIVLWLEDDILDLIIAIFY